MDSAIVAVDVGGSSLKSGIVTLPSATICDRRTNPIESSGSANVIFATLTNVILSHLDTCSPAFPIGIALAFPGPFEYGSGVSQIAGLAKYDAIYNLNVRDELHNRIGADLPIRFCNDAEAAILGESIYGAGRDHERIIGVTLGTGFGSGYVIAAHPVKRGTGVPPHGWLHSFETEGVRADDVFSTRGLRRLLADRGINHANVETAARAARNGDIGAIAAFRSFGRRLGSFLLPFTSDFQPDAVLVLGGISNAFDLFGPSLQDMIPPPVLKGQLEGDAPLLGASRLFSPTPAKG